MTATTVAPANFPSNPVPPPEHTPPSPRFTLELEFVLSLSNPYYLSHLALTYPHLLNPPASATETNPSKPSQNLSHPTLSSPAEPPESDASKFASYLSYLYSYWRRPEYARFLTHPGATLRNLQLLQQERFRREIIRPDVIERLVMAGPDRSEGTREGGEGEEKMVGGEVGGSTEGEKLAADVKEEEEGVMKERDT